MTDYIYDEECYPNFFSAGFMNAENPTERYYFEISHRRNDAIQLAGFTYWFGEHGHRMVGFNSVGYDYVLLHAIATNPHAHNCATIYQISQLIFTSEGFDKPSVWESDHICTQIDLFKIHHFDNKARGTGLKDIEIALRLDNVQDLPYKPGSILTESEMDHLGSYMWNDIEATHELYLKTEKAISFREEMSEKMGVNCLNYNDTKIGKEYITIKLEERSPGVCFKKVNGKKVKNQTFRHQIPVEDVVFPYIRFDSEKFKSLHSYLMRQVITDTKKGFENAKCTVDNFDYHLGMGGIHGCIKPGRFYSNDERIIIDLDVKGYYVNLPIVNRFYPEHLGEVYCNIMKEISDQRDQHPSGSTQNKALKLAGNGTYGDTNSVFSVFYDPKYTMTCTINGQLLLCMLAEVLSNIHGLVMLQVNTDGLTVDVDRKFEPLIMSICKWWENYTCLTLERNDYSRMFIRDVNNYIAEGVDGKLKNKGCFVHSNLELHKDHSHLVVPKAVEAFLIDGTPVEDFIRGHQDRFDFMGRAKVPRNSKLVAVHDGVDHEQQRITRYFVSTEGFSLVKIMPTTEKQRLKSPEKLIKRSGVAPTTDWLCTVCNHVDSFDWSTLNYDFYIAEAKKITKYF